MPLATTAPERKSAPGVGVARPKNRAWGFFGDSVRCSWEIDPQVVETYLATTTAGSKTASGVPYWPSRDPIGERGGANLYGMLGNNGVNQIDVLGRNPLFASPAIYSGIIAGSAYLTDKIMDYVLEHCEDPDYEPSWSDFLSTVNFFEMAAVVGGAMVLPGSDRVKEAFESKKYAALVGSAIGGIIATARQTWEQLIEEIKCCPDDSGSKHPFELGGSSAPPAPSPDDRWRSPTPSGGSGDPDAQRKRIFDDKATKEDIDATRKAGGIPIRPDGSPIPPPQGSSPPGSTPARPVFPGSPQAGG